ncbi:conserved hypothetical protein [uncultured Mycobacterium sp.]|uniref:DUF4192 domain-containing protein n=1 Tax=uncultured Mycobacterium sp. TaxID=171292 RepID=A0A1Y5PFM5_9MYCO|nr:conserved hypothetical protein [uncultured Mycobacterium sp.]
MSELNINNTADILAAVPAILGFTPESSIVVLTLHQEDRTTLVRNVLRFDINPTAARTLTTVAAPAFRTVTAAVLLAVCGDQLAELAAETLDIVRDQLATLDVDIIARLHTANLDQPGNWTNIDTGDRGPLTPYRDSRHAFGKVLRGEPLVATRDDVVAEFTPTTNPAPLTTTPPTEFLVETFETVAAIITGSTPATAHPELATRVGILITSDVHMRDTMLLLSIDNAEPAGRLWTHLANQLTGVARLEALTLAAACYYAGADAVRAGIALDVAAHDANDHRLDYPRLANLLHTALSAGISPTEIRHVLNSIGTRRDN